MPLLIWVKETLLNIGYWRETLMCTLVDVLAMWHISMVRKNKTGLRASLTTDGSLSAILKVELNNPNLSHPFNPSSSLIEKSKKEHQ
jgi:hypothetical protein